VHRISVIGQTGSGKSTLAAALASKLGVPYVELDALHWEPNWTMANTEVFRGRVGQVVAGDRWVVDGNYSKVRDLVWGRADTVVWLDYPFALTFARLVRRTLGRVRSGEELWNGNRERIAEQFLSRDSLFVWAIKSYGRHRSLYPALLASEAYAHLRVIRLHTSRETQRWLASI